MTQIATIRTTRIPESATPTADYRVTWQARLGWPEASPLELGGREVGGYVGALGMAVVEGVEVEGVVDLRGPEVLDGRPVGSAEDLVSLERGRDGLVGGLGTVCTVLDQGAEMVWCPDSQGRLVGRERVGLVRNLGTADGSHVNRQGSLEGNRMDCRRER